MSSNANNCLICNLDAVCWSNPLKWRRAEVTRHLVAAPMLLWVQTAQHKANGVGVSVMGVHRVVDRKRLMPLVVSSAPLHPDPRDVCSALDRKCGKTHSI
eukprot:1766548-Amphidinium_carterae.1